MSNNIKIAAVIVFTAIIVGLEFLLGSFTNKITDEIDKDIEELKISLLAENYEESKKKSEDLDEKWEKYEDKFCYFFDHEEIEKMSTKVAVIKENTANREYKLALEDSIETKYLLEHVKDKLKLKLNNVF